jgi:signal transduction histidine kinase
MDEATRNHLFEPFFTTRPVGKGTELGLPTVYGIVRQFGRQIQLDSQPGAGTRFQIFFPVTEANSSKPAPAPSP